MQLYLECKVYARFLELGGLAIGQATPTSMFLLLEKEVLHPISQQLEDGIILELRAIERHLFGLEGYRFSYLLY
jgi:hypothetical protein